MDNAFHEQRAYQRFKADVDVQFSFRYEIETEMEYQVVDGQKAQQEEEKYQAKSKNISSQGLCFSSPMVLHKGDGLIIDMFLPNSDTSIQMEGQVCWSRKSEEPLNDNYVYETGIEILTVKGQPVDETIYYDQNYHIYWSLVLESVLGSYRKYVQEKKLEE